MPARRRRSQPRSTPKSDAREVMLTARIAELEWRIKLLEARVRNVSADVRKQGEPASGEGLAKARRRARERPRCLGCLLELPPGRRGESCVWCGFIFDAVRPAP